MTADPINVDFPGELDDEALASLAELLVDLHFAAAGEGAAA